jgi:prepilin-type N-terminal cleavage/methylation domain-containing protein
MHRESGFTLVELLLTMGLLSIFLLILTTIFTATLDTQTQSESYSAVSQDGRFVLARISYDVMRAATVTTPAALGGSGASLGLTIGSTAYTYALSGSTLQLTDGTGTANLTGGDVSMSALTFQRIGNSGGKDTIRVTFTLTSVATAHSGADVQTFTTTVGRR